MHTHSSQLVSLSLPRAMRLLLAAFFCMLFAGVAQAQDFTVSGTSGRNWVDTGLDIAPGTLLQLSATGTVDVGSGWGSWGPEGTRRFADVPGYPAETLLRYGLVASLTAGRSSPGDGEIWSYVEAQPHCAEQGGHLWLTVNDDNAANNTGAFMVHVAPRTPCPGQAERGRFRVTLIKFFVNTATVDGLLTGDGQGDEVYAVAEVSELTASGVPLGERSLESLTYGDISRDNGLPARIRAGNAPTTGGLETDDSYPPPGEPPPTSPRGIPMILWEGELRTGANRNAVVILPTIWELDNDRVMFGDWQAQAPGFIRTFGLSAIDFISGRQSIPLITRSDVLRSSITRNDFDRPIGIQGDAFVPLVVGRATFSPWRMFLNFSMAERLARTLSGPDGTPGVFQITYDDGPRYGSGRYTLFLRIERVSAEVAPVLAEVAACQNTLRSGSISWGGGTTWASGNIDRLCNNTRNARSTISCFQSNLEALGWAAAIDRCR